MNSDSNPKGDQCPLSQVWVNVPQSIHDMFRELSVTTAEEFLGILSSGMPKPECIDAPMWDSMRIQAQGALSEAEAKKFTSIDKRKYPILHNPST